MTLLSASLMYTALIENVNTIPKRQGKKDENDEKREKKKLKDASLRSTFIGGEP